VQVERSKKLFIFLARTEEKRGVRVKWKKGGEEK